MGLESGVGIITPARYLLLVNSTTLLGSRALNRLGLTDVLSYRFVLQYASVGELINLPADKKGETKDSLEDVSDYTTFCSNV